MRRLVWGAVVVCVLGATACTTSTGGSGGSSDGSGYPPCTAGIKVSSTRATPKAPPTLVNDPSTDLQLETAGAGTLYDGPPLPSADGSRLLFRTSGQSVVPGGFLGDDAWVLRDRATGQNTVVTSNKLGEGLMSPQSAGFLPDGSIAFGHVGYWLPQPSDAQGVAADDEWLSEIYRWDLNTQDLSVMSLGADDNPIAVYPWNVPTPADAPVYQAQGPENLKVTPDGRYLFFETAVPLGLDDPPGRFAATPGGGTLDLFRRDMVTGDIVKVDVGNHPELGALANGGGSNVLDYDVSADGNHVAFAAPATGGLAETGYCQYAALVFLRDINAGTTTLVSHDTAGRQRYGTLPHISADGRFVTYKTFADNGQGTYTPAPGIANLAGVRNVMWDQQTDTTDWVLPTAAGTPAATSLGIGDLSITPDNNLFLFTTVDDGPNAQGVVPGDGDGQPEVVLYNRAANTIRKVSQLSDGTNISPSGNARYQVVMSDDGSRAFIVTDQTLLPADTNPGMDIYSIALH
jgi:hypothetical protein